MPKQYIKSIYFPLANEAPAGGGKKQFGRVVAVAFNTTPEQESVYRLMRPLSSEEIREALGLTTYEDLEGRAAKLGTKPGAYIRDGFREQHDRLAQGKKPSAKFASVSARLKGFRKAQQDVAIVPELTPFRGMAPSIEDSPQRVTYILDTYAAGCRYVLDPFSGTGNIPIVAGQRGIASGYCEIEPVFRFFSDVKFDLLSRTEAARKEIAGELERRSRRLAQDVEDRKPSPWFAGALSEALDHDDDVASWLASARALIDDLSAEDPMLARAIATAVVSARARLERREKLSVGGLQAATGDEMRKLAEFTEQDELLQRPSFLCENARDLGALRHIGADAVVTSTPPVLFSDPPDRHVDHLVLGFTTRTSRARSRREDRSSPKIPKDLAKAIRKLRENTGEAVALRVMRTISGIDAAFEGVIRHLTPNATIVVDVESPEYIDVGSHVESLFAKHEFALAATEEFGRRRPTRQASGGITKHELLVFRRGRQRARRGS